MLRPGAEILAIDEQFYLKSSKALSALAFFYRILDDFTSRERGWDNQER